MKIFLVVLAVIAAVTAEEWQPKKLEEISAIRSECLASNPLSADVLEKMKSFEYPDEESTRNYISCCLKKVGVFCEHEGFHVDRIVKQFKLKMDEAVATAVAEKCADKNEQKSSIDVWVYRGHKCLMNSELGEQIKQYVINKKKA